MSMLVRAMRLAPEEKARFFRACYWLGVCAWHLRRRGFNDVIELVERETQAAAAASDRDEGDISHSIVVWHRAVGRAARVLPIGTCLERAVTLQLLLGRQHIETALRIGVRPGEAALHAHAWLERDGEPLLETVDPELRRNVFSGPWARRRAGSRRS